MSVKTKRMVTALLAGVIVVAMMLSIITPVFADDLDTLEQQQQELEEQAANAEALKNATEEEVAAAQDKVDAMKAEMQGINDQIFEVGNRIADLNKKIQDNEEKLEIKEGELAQAKEDLKVYYAALKDRIQMMYESDRSGYLEILLNASSISEFFSKLEYISQMVEYDNHIMEELDACRATIQESKEAIETAKAELESDRSEEQKEQEALQAVLNDKQTTLDSLEGDQLALELMAQEQASHYDSIMASISENETAMQNEKDRLAAEEEARRRAEEEANNANAGGSNDVTGGSGEETNGGGESNGGGSYYDPSDEPSGGDSSDRALANGYYQTWPGIGNRMLGWPCDSWVLSSLYGPRIHPITGEYKNHGGIDFNIDYGCPIYSSGSGIVTEANLTDSWGGGWGYYVVISHDNGLQTLYAHCSDIYVTEGQRVEMGECIAAVGSTGMSTGPHLHFEVYSGGGRVNPEDYL